jgi:signal transduction histidine kinase
VAAGLPKGLARRLGDPRTAMATGALLFVLLVAALLAFTLERSRAQRLADARALTDQLARSVEQHAHRTILTIDATLAALASVIEAPESEAVLGGGELRSMLRLLGQQVFVISDIVVLDGDGNFVDSGSGRPTLMTEPGLGDFIATARRAEGRALVIGRPLLSRHKGEWMILAGRALDLSGRKGHVIAEVAVEAFTEFHRSINSPRGTRIAVVADDGTLIGARPQLPGQIGEKVADPLEMAIRAAAATAPPVEEVEILGESSPSVVSWRRIPGRPLFVAAATSRAAALAEWRREAWQSAAALAGVTLVTGLLVAGLCRLVRRRHDAERAQREAQARLARGIEAMSDAFILFDAQDRVVMWNTKYVSFFPYLADVLYPGIAFEEVLDHTVRNAPLGLAPDELESWRRWRREGHRNPGKPFEQVHADGRCFHTVVRKSDGGETVVVIREIGELKRAERAARLARDAAEQANRTKSAFLANMSHELRTPLNAILGFSDIIKSGMFGAHERYQEYAGDINAAGGHLLRLVNDILDLSKIESGAMELREGQVQLETLVEACCELVRPRATEAGVRLSAQVQSRLPPIHADELRLKQVLLNLLSNAVKFTPSGGSIGVAAECDAAGGTLLRVSDTGIGMQPEDIPVALQDFGQVDSSLARRFEGSGLGLPLSRRLAELHGGTLEIESAPERGTTVTVRLPAWRTQAAREVRLSA